MFYGTITKALNLHGGFNRTVGLGRKTKNQIVAEYAVRDLAKPLGIAAFRHLEQLPEQLKGTLPTIEEIEAELGSSNEPEE